MKLLHVSMHYFPVKGGQEVYIEQLNNNIANLYNEIYVLQPSVRYNGIWPKNVIKTMRLSILPRYFPGINWLWFNLTLVFYRKFISKFDVVITHYSVHYNFTKFAKKNIVVSHGIEWDKPTLTYVDRYRKKMAHSVNDGNTIVVANDTDFLREIGIQIQPREKEFTEIEKNIWYIPNCTDIKLFNKNNTVVKENIILVPRNIRKDRGIHFAIEIFKEFNKKNGDFKMLIAGGPIQGDYYNECVKLIGSYNLHNKVIFLGSKAVEELTLLYQTSRIVLIPTLAKEGTSLSALEAMACGTLTFSTSIGGLIDLPTEKISLDAKIAASEILNKIDPSLDLAKIQYEETRRVFNFDNWSKAWIDVLKNENVNDR
jgi:glycosyltransferase involved in cell wall biosynthesis